MKENLKKLIIATALMSSFISVGLFAASECDEDLEEEMDVQKQLTPVQRRERLTPEEKEELDKDLVVQSEKGHSYSVLDLLLKGADPNARYRGQAAFTMANRDTARGFVFAGASYSDSDKPSDGGLWYFINDAVAEKEKAFDTLKMLKKVLKVQMIENPHMPVEKLASLSVLASVSVNDQVPCTRIFKLAAQYLAYKILDVLVAYEWKKIKEELTVEQEVGRVLPINDIVNLVLIYMYPEKAVASGVSAQSVE